MWTKRQVYIYAYQKNMVSPALVLQNSTLLNYTMEILCIKFYSNWMKNVENMGKFSFTALNEVWLPVCQCLQIS